MGAAHSKLAFKKSVFRLFEERNITSNANEYWEQFWTLPETSDDVFSLVSSADIRQVRDNARENLECLIEKTLAHLFRLVESPTFPSAQAPAAQVLNCLRVLTRIFPFIFESEEWMDWEERYFWVPRTVVVSVKRSSTLTNSQLSSQEITEQPQHQSQDSNGQRTAPKEEFMELEEKPVPSHGHRLVQTLIDLLFTSGFTIPTAVETREKVSYVIWETGIGSSTPIGTSKELEDNRVEVLRLLLVLFSRSMYVTPAVTPITENRWIEAVVTGNNCKSTIAILCSLINSAMKYNPSGWGLPYNHVMFSNDQRELLVMLCLQVVIVLLNYRPIDVVSRIANQAGTLRIGGLNHHTDPNHSSGSSGSPQSAIDLVGKNQFRHYLSRLHREQDFTFLMDGMYRILSNPMAASSTYLPGSTKQVKCYQEMMMLCWKTLELNKRFRHYLLDTRRVLDIVIILLYFAMENKLDASHIGVVRMCACMLHTLSSDRAFGSSLNKTFDGHTSLPSSMRIPNFHGTYGDYLIQSIHSLIATTKRTLRSLYPSLVMTIHNISPSLKRISSTTANRLLQLTVSFGSPSFLLAEASNHELLGNMLDAINYMLYYQASENPNLIYAMVQYETKLQSMAKFTLANGLEDIHRLRLAKERQAAASSLQQQSPPQSSRRPSLTQRSMSSDRVAMASQGTKRPSVKTRTSTSTISSIDTPTHSTFGNPLGSHSATTGAASTHHLPPVYSDGQWSPTPLSSRSVWKAEDSSSSTSKTASGTSAHVNRLSLERAEKDRANRLSRLDSADSILTPLSDGGGNEGDVEDEGGLSTMPRARKLSNGSSNGGAGGGADHPSDSGLPISLEGLSEKQRGKLPEAVAERLSRASSDQEEGGDHGFHERSYFTRKDTKHPSGLAPLIHPGGGGGEEGGSAATTTRYKPLEARSITSQGVMLTTTVYDVGQNGFVPTEEWVEGWMKDARFEPIVVTLKHTVPVIEQLQATTDQQVLEFIQREISPRMLTSILPSYTFSTATASVVDGGASLSASSSSSTLSSPSPVTATGATTSAPTAAPSSTTIKPPIIMHKFVWGELTVWFDGLLWSQIYLGGMGRLGRQGMGAWHETRVRLFVVRVSSSTQQQQQQASLGTGMRQQYSAQSHAAGGSNLLGSSGSRGTARSLSMTSSSSPSSSSPLSNLYNAIPRTIVTAAPMSPTVTTAPSPVS